MSARRGIYERFPGSGRWSIRYADSTGRIRRERVTWTSIRKAGIRVDAKSKLAQPGKDLAERLLNARKAACSRGENLEPLHQRRVLFGELCDDSLAYIKAHNRGWQVDKIRIAKLKGKFGAMAADSLPVAELRKWMDAQDWSPATHNRYKAVLSLTYRLAIENGKAKTNPARLLKRRTESNIRLRWLLPEEEVQLRKVIGDKFRWHQSEFEIALNTGMRPSEMFGLRWQDVDLKRRQITLLETKTGKPRHLPINTACLRAFEELQARPIRKEHVFLSQSGQRLVGHRWFEDAASDAGIMITWYQATRHTFASRLTMAGVDLRTIANLMGHSTIQMTMRYAHLAPEHQLAAVERLTAIATDTKSDTEQATYQ